MDKLASVVQSTVTVISEESNKLYDFLQYEIEQAAIASTSDRKYMEKTEILLAERKERLRHGPEMILFHQTTQDAAKQIVETGLMKRGKTGLAGPGIYFADKRYFTNHKRNPVKFLNEERTELINGVVLECRVKMGRTLALEARGDSTLEFTRLLLAGYDSVVVDRVNGKEYVAYGSDQVLVLRQTHTGFGLDIRGRKYAFS